MRKSVGEELARCAGRAARGHDVAAAVVAVSVFYFVLFNIEGSILVPSIEGNIVPFDRARSSTNPRARRFGGGHG